MDIPDLPIKGIKAKINGKTLAIGVPITSIVAALIYFCTLSYNNNEKLSVMEPALTQHFIANASHNAEILTELKNIDRRLQRIEARLDASNKIAYREPLLAGDNRL